MPDFSTVKRWLRRKGLEEFRAQYAQAREDRAHLWAEEIVDIADDGSNDYYERDGEQVVDHENIQRSRLRVDTRKWILSKLLPKEYGDSVASSPTEDLKPAKIVYKPEALPERLLSKPEDKAKES